MKAIEVEIEAQDSRFGGTYQVSEVNGPDIKAENNFDQSPVKTVSEDDHGRWKPDAVHLPATLVHHDQRVAEPGIRAQTRC